MSTWWADASGGAIPDKAIPISTVDGETLYVGRQELNGDLIPGKIAPSQGVIYVGQNMNEYCCNDYQIFCCEDHCALTWRAANGGGIPERAIEAGLVGSTGEVLYIARGRPSAEDPSMVQGGKLHSSHGCAYIVWGGKEHQLQDYEVLCAV